MTRRRGVPGVSVVPGRPRLQCLAGVLAIALVGACAAPQDVAHGGGETEPPTPCTDVSVLFARGTGQPPGLGRVGEPFVRALAADLPGRSVGSYGVDYPADRQQRFGPGTTDVVRRVAAVARSCPATRFVLGGYSQGALVVAAAIGVSVDGVPPEKLSAELVNKVAAVVVFGNPLGGTGALTLEATGVALARRAIDICATGDGVCGRRGPLSGTHRDYPDNGGTDQAAAFAAAELAG